MRYMLIINAPEDLWVSKENIEKIVPWKEKLAAEGIHLTGNPLEPAGMTFTVSRDATGAIITTDEPADDIDAPMFAFEIIECADKDQAVGIARTHPVLQLDKVTIEVRQIWDSMGEDYLGRPCHG